MSTKQPTILGHPLGLLVLFFTEMWERFSFYGMKAILVLFLVSQVDAANPGFGWSEAGALQLFGVYTMMVYVMSIPGGILADRVLGQKKAVMLGGLLLVAGHGLMAWPEEWAFFIALTLIILGVGLLKPNISTMVGGLYKPGDPKRDTGFTIFYMGINLGALLATVIVAYVGEEIGWHYGFGLAGIGMLLGQIVYIGGQSLLRDVGNRLSSKFSEHGDTEPTNTGLTKVQRDRLTVIFISFIIVAVFWMAFEQAGGLLTLYAKKYTDRNVADLFTVPAAAVQAANPFFILVFGAVVAYVWSLFSRGGKGVTTIFKMGVGSILLGLGFLFMVVAANQKEQEKQQVTREVQVSEQELEAYLADNAEMLQDKGFDVAALSGSALQNDTLLYEYAYRAPEDEQAKEALEKAEENLIDRELKAVDIQQTAGGGAVAKLSVVETVVTQKSWLLWLILAYLFHTLGELSLSPVALSFITKLSPPRLVSTMMGLFFAVTGVANLLAALIGSLSAQLGELAIFWFLVLFPVTMGLGLILASGKLRQLAHGAEEVQEDEVEPGPGAHAEED